LQATKKNCREIVEYVSRALHNSQQQQQQIVMCFVFGGLNAKLVSLQNPTTYMNTPTLHLIGA
jgi:hypothetical protein